MTQAIRIDDRDNVAVALLPLAGGSSVLGVTLAEDIPAGHKFALHAIRSGSAVIKYGHPIGAAARNIAAGEWVHTHNMRTALTGEASYVYAPAGRVLPPESPLSFAGYRRADGRVGIRNELWILPLVGCVNDVCKCLEQQCAALFKAYGLDGVYHFPHPYGCSQLGGDLCSTRRILADLCRHPNAGGVLVVGLGCENNTLSAFLEELGPGYEDKLRFLLCQSVGDEIAEGKKLLEELTVCASGFSRQTVSVAELTVGLKCGGSDGLSGITANPAVGRFSDRLIAMGGSTILTEVPEMFGAETILLNRCADETLFRKAADMVNGFKAYFLSHGQPVGENPSPGNKDGGITTLEDKSLGCIQKGGQATVRGILSYGERVQRRGLHMLCAPGNDLVSSTALAAAGAQLILFTTGRGTPFSAPVPTLKISSNTDLFRRKPNWIDMDAGSVAAGESLDNAGDRLLRLVVSTASGQLTCSERNAQRGIAIWKDGVTL